MLLNIFALSFASAAWGILSGLAVGILGLSMLRGGKARPRGALAFGLFSLFWGLQAASGNIATLVSAPEIASILYLLFLAFHLPTTYLLVEFAASQDPAPTRRAGWVVLRSLIGGASVLAAILFALEPSFVYNGVRILPDRILPIWGTAQPFLVVVPHFLAFALAILTLRAATRSAATPRLASRSALTLAGLGVYASFAAGNNGIFYLGISFFGEAFGTGGAPPTMSTYLFTLLFGGLSALALWIGIGELRRARATRDATQRRAMHLHAAAFLVPLSWGAVEGFLALEALPLFQTVGLWRLLTVALLAYGIASWRVYDLPQRARRAAANAAGASTAVTGGALAYGAGSLASSTTLVPAVLGVLVLAGAIMPSLRFARWLFGLDQREGSHGLEAALYGQRIDAYRAAVEASLARGTFDEDRTFLEALRERFHITPDEDRLITHLARGSVIVPRGANAWEAYERLRLLGEGGGGRSWLARDRARDRLVVLKEPLPRWQLDAAARETVLREARLAAKVRHPNVVTVEDVVEGKGSPVIVMEYLEGGNVSTLVRERGTLAWEQARDITLDIAHGLEAVHAAGIVHRDVKPSNILLTGEGVAKVADFGIAVSPATSGERTLVIDPSHSTIAGTLHYMAPEARAGNPPDRRADIYACAAVLHEMLYGAPPGQHSPVVVRHDLPAGLPTLLARALAVRPEDRPQTARALADELARLR